MGFPSPPPPPPPFLARPNIVHCSMGAPVCIRAAAVSSGLAPDRLRRACFHSFEPPPPPSPPLQYLLENGICWVIIRVLRCFGFFGSVEMRNYPPVQRGRKEVREVGNAKQANGVSAYRTACLRRPCITRKVGLTQAYYNASSAFCSELENTLYVCFHFFSWLW